MLLIQLILDGVISGCAIGVVAITFAYVYATTGTFHVAHAGVYTLAGYVAWFLVDQGLPFLSTLVLATLVCALVGALIQWSVYAPLARRGASPLVMLIASLGLLAVLQNLVAMAFSPNFTTFDLPWRLDTVSLGPIVLSYAQILTAVSSIAILFGLLAFSYRTPLGSRIRAVASNRDLAEIVRLRPLQVYIYVIAIASALVAAPSIFVGIDQAMQPYTSTLVLLVAVIAVIAGGIGSLTGAFIIAVALSVLQNIVLAAIPGRWSIAVTFCLFILFILVRPTGLFRTRLTRAT